jgi:hypothetical protein
MKFSKLKSAYTIFIITIFIIIVTSVLSMVLDENVSTTVTISTAIIGGTAIWYQMKKDKDINKAEFIFNLNANFTSDPEISYIYLKLKEFRADDTIVFTKSDGIRMGNYIMFFEIINYLIEEDIIDIEMVDNLFSNRFFIMTNNPYTQKYQLNNPNFTTPIFRLYTYWYNYRLKKKKSIPYEHFALHVLKKEYFLVKSNSQIELRG